MRNTELGGAAAEANPTRRASRSPSLETLRQRVTEPNALGRVVLGWITGVLLLFLPLWLVNSDVLFSIGIILIFFISAVGLHLLVNWTGELSLAHGSVLGLVALSVARISINEHVHALLIVPIGILIGAGAGLTLAAVAFRVRGFYVAIVTLAVAVVINTFFFTSTWLVGDGTLTIQTLRIGSWTLSTPEQLYPVLVVAVILSVYGFRRVTRSRFGRSMLMVRRHPTAAAAQGVNVAGTRALAYVVAGIFAGLAGGLSAMWVQSVAPSTYAQSTNLDFLTAIVVAGPGSLVAVGEVTAALEGIRLLVSSTGPVITYIGPIGLVVTLVRFPGGLASLNGLAKRRLVSLAGPFGRRGQGEGALPVREGLSSVVSAAGDPPPTASG